jgi:hypothetical protein
MTIFSGHYLTDPIDLAVVCTEADIIAVCDDPGGAEATTALTFADLDATQTAAIVAVMDSLIRPVEATINSYARSQGYLIPLTPLDDDVKELAARLLWVGMRQHAKRITAQQAEDEREAFRKGTLSDIARGFVVLTAAKATDRPAQRSTVYKVSGASSRDSEGAVPRLSRKSMERF